MDFFIRIAGIVLPVFAIVLIGYMYGRKNDPNMSVANNTNIDLFCPALIFSTLSNQEINLIGYTNLAIVAIAIILLSGVVTYPVSRFLKMDSRTFVPPTMFTNSGNLGLPIMLFAFGEEFLAAAVLLFIIENTLHFTVGLNMINRQSSIIKNLASPMVIAAALGIAVSLFNVQIWSPIAISIEMLGQISIPLMLFALGVRLFQTPIQYWRLGFIAGLVTPLSGLIIAFTLIPFFELGAAEKAMLIVYAALPPAVLNYIVAERYNQEPSAVASIVMVGNLLSIFIIPIVLAFSLAQFGS